MMRLSLVVLVACGAPSRPAALEHRLEPTREGPRIFRQLSAGRARKAAHRTTFELVLDGTAPPFGGADGRAHVPAVDAERAVLVETEQTAANARTIDEVDRGARWTTTSTRTYRGTDHGGELDLATEDMQPLHLHCVATVVDAAGPGARLVPSPDRPADYECGDRGVWDPPATRRVDALVCSASGQPADEAVDDDRLVFGVAPGLEWAGENDDCAIQGAGLRVAK